MAIGEFLPTASQSKLSGLCKTRWVECHTCFEVFLEFYEPFVTFLDAVLCPTEYPQLSSSDSSWYWDAETRIKAQGLKSSLSSFQNVATFIITKNVLDEAKSVSSKLQKCEQDFYDALGMVEGVTEELCEVRSSIDSIFPLWYAHIVKLAQEIGVPESVPRKIRLQRNRSNTPKFFSRRTLQKSSCHSSLRFFDHST